MRARFLAVPLCLISATAGAAIYQCEADGKRVFQDTPCDAAAKPLDVKPANGSVAKGPDTSLRKADAELRERMRKADREREADIREHTAFQRDCQDKADRAEREAPFLKSISGVVREQARITIAQLQDDMYRSGCRR